MWVVPRTGVERTIIDLAREHGTHAGVVAADGALHAGLTTADALSRAIARCRRWPGVRAARDALELADGRSESVLESRSRLALHRSGLPMPELQVAIGNEWGGFVARVDFYWDEFGVVGEADGDVKYDGTDPQTLLAEKKRQSRLEDLGLEVVRWNSADLRNFDAVAARLRRAFGRRGARPRQWTVLPRTLPS
jgi:very-short-patch-repair endonuclease